MSEQLEPNLSAKEAAQVLGISRPMLVRLSLSKDGKPPQIGSYKMGARRVYGVHHLKAYMHSCENAGELDQEVTGDEAPSAR